MKVLSDLDKRAMSYVLFVHKKLRAKKAEKEMKE